MNPISVVLVRRSRTLLWFLRRPRLYPHLIDLIQRRLFHGTALENTREQALQWCVAQSEDTPAAIKRLTGLQIRGSVEEMFAEIFSEAHRRANQCAGRMGGPGNLDLLYRIAEHLKAARVVETGVGFGWSALAILLSLKNRPGSLLCSTDRPPHEGNYDQDVGCVVPADLRPNWRLFNWADKQALPKALEAAGTLDMCHYDSDKTYAGRTWAYPLLWQALRPGGIFISDDVEDNLAFRDFSRLVSCDPIVIKHGNKYVGVIVKHAGQQKTATL